MSNLCLSSFTNQIQLISFCLEIIGLSLAVTEIFFSKTADKIEKGIDYLGDISYKNFDYIGKSIMRISLFQRLVLLLIIFAYMENQLNKFIMSKKILGEAVSINPNGNLFLIFSLIGSFCVCVIFFAKGKYSHKNLSLILEYLFRISFLVLIVAIVCSGLFKNYNLSLNIAIYSTSVLFAVLLFIPIISITFFLLNKIIKYLNEITDEKAITGLGLMIATLGFIGEIYQLLIMFKK
tara:strand:- start:5581 stop:6288 length:708 start_codon:yes stop_codon:yes gene_type:complete